MASTVADQLFADAPAFEFFQAIRLLEQFFPERQPIGSDARPDAEIVRIRSHLSLAFPPSALHALLPPIDDRPYAVMIQTFMGLTGPSGVLPRHYTQLLMDLDRDVRGPERKALADWFALFDHRLVSLFYRAWDKYRFYRAYERQEAFRTEPDPFSRAVLSLIGFGTPHLRDRLHISYQPPDSESRQTLAVVDDLSLFYYSGLLAKQPRSAHGLELMLQHYFQHPIKVEMFQGQWLLIDPADQTCLGRWGRLGVDAIAGDRVWDVASRFRVRVGPLDRRRFEEFLPDRTAIPRRKSLFVLSQLIRLYCGPEFDFDIQLELQARDVPECQLVGEGFGARLGWNTWLLCGPAIQNRDDAIFVGDEDPSIEVMSCASWDRRGMVRSYET